MTTPRCICDWPADCAGIGVLHCDGCGGDVCVCPCGGTADCHGCDRCDGDFGDYPEDEE